jgi:hypothetical protein
MTCQCNPGTWTTDPDPICAEYAPGEAGFCQQCWHDKACHYSTWEEAIRADERAKVLAKIKGAFGL